MMTLHYHNLNCHVYCVILSILFFCAAVHYIIIKERVSDQFPTIGYIAINFNGRPLPTISGVSTGLAGVGLGCTMQTYVEPYQYIPPENFIID